MLVGVLAAPTVLLAGACGDDGGDDGATSDEVEAALDGDACDLLSDEQVADVLGAGVEEELTPSGPEVEQPASCTWSVPGASVNLADPQPTGITAFVGDRQIFDNTRVLAEDGAGFDEIDLGDQAYAGNGVGGLLVGDTGITVAPLGPDVNAPATQDLIVELLGMVADNL